MEKVDPLKGLRVIPKTEPQFPQCWDCREEISNPDDLVMESRCTGGDSHTEHPRYYYDDVPVHANRKVCIANKEIAREAEKRRRDPFYDVPSS